MAEKLTIGFLGAGKMATALAKGFLHAGLITPKDLIASDVIDAARSAFTHETGAQATASNLDVARFADVLFIAVKPVNVPDLLAEIRPEVSAKKLFISIAAGVTLAKLEDGLGSHTGQADENDPAKNVIRASKPRVVHTNPAVRMIRVMPNTPALVGASATAFALGQAATPDDAQLAQKLFSSVGIAYQVKENLLDAVTGLSGSGPAYVYMMIEALSDGGVAAGLPRDVSTKLAAQTVLGSARMVLETGIHPGALKDMVTSPGGTTIEGVHELEKGGVRAALITAVRAASDKSRKLGQG